MNARALLAWVGAVLLVALAGQDPVVRALALLAALLVVVRCRRPGVRVRRALLAVGSASLLAVLLSLLLNHTGATVLFELPPWIPALGGQVTLEGAAYGLDVALGMAACFVAGISLSLVAEPYQLVDSMPPVLSRSAAAVGAAMTLVPRLGHSFLAVREAQQLRGWRPRGVRSWGAVVVPAVVTAIEGSVLLAEAMEARAYGSARRSCSAELSWSRGDLIVLGASLAAVAALLAGLCLGQLAAWQPYPDLTAPSLGPLPLLACLLLLAPLLRR